MSVGGDGKTIKNQVFPEGWWWWPQIKPLPPSRAHLNRNTIKGQVDGSSLCLTVSRTFCRNLFNSTFHALFLMAWLADGDSLTCCIVMMGRQIAKMFSTFSL